jgi:hypothetical protein
VGYVALVFAFSGSAYAANKITSADIANNTIRTVDIRNGTLKQADMSAGAMPEMLMSAQPAGEQATQGTPTPVVPPLNLGPGQYRYLVFATIETNGGDVPYHCKLQAARSDTDVTQQQIDMPPFYGRTMTLVVGGGASSATANLLCWDDDANRENAIQNAKLVAIRMSRG